MTTTTFTENINQNYTEITESQIGTFLQEHSEVEMVLPVVLGLFATSRLQLRGANALLANLLIASLTRQVIMQLKKQAPTSVTVVEETSGFSDQTPTNNLAGYSIVHSVPGRVRLRIPRLVNDQAFAQRLERLLLADEYVISVRINRAAASLVINYAAEGLSDWELGLRLMNIINGAEAEVQPEVN